MNIFWSALLCALIGNALCKSKQVSSEVDSQKPGVEKGYVDAIVHYINCIEKGSCDTTVVPENVTQQEVPKPMENSKHKDPKHEVKTPEQKDKFSYLKICEKIHLKMMELESVHPELASLKFQLLVKLNSYVDHFTSEFKDGESSVTKLLNFVIYVAEKLKVDFKKTLYEKPGSSTEPDILAEEPELDNPGFVGSVRGVPGEHYPNYNEIPITSFSCSDKYIPGFYADLETGCQVFHVCYEHSRESFLCPLGTIFNQPILACDYWYSSNCSQAPIYYDVNDSRPNEDLNGNEVEGNTDKLNSSTKGEVNVPQVHVGKRPLTIGKFDLKDLMKFFPIKAQVLEFPKPPKVVHSKDEVAASNIFNGMIATGTKVASVARKAIKSIPEPEQKVATFPKIKPLPLFKPKLAIKTMAAIPFVKSKVVSSAAIPVAKAKLATAAKAKIAVPAIKAKFIVASAVPVVKAKVASAAAIPIAKVLKAGAVKAKVAIPMVKSKFLALPLAKTKYAAAKIPMFKAKTAAKVMPIVKMAAIKSKAVPIKVKSAAKAVPIVKMAAMKSKAVPIKVKSAAFAIPVVKAKFAKAALISPLTKKALAIGYMKLLKAKKLALVG